MIYLDNNTALQDLYIPRQTPRNTSGVNDWASKDYVNSLMDSETARTETTYAKKSELSAYTPTTGFTTINGQPITDGGNITIEGTAYEGGDNISISGRTISVTGIPTEFKTVNGSAITGTGNIEIEGAVYSAGTNINIDSANVISVTGITVPTKVSELDNDEGFATTGWVEDQHYLTEHQSLSAYSTTSEVEGMISAATASTTGWVESQGYLTEHQSLSAYSTTSEVENMVSAATAATTGWVEDQHYLTEHQSLSAYSTTSEVEGMISAATASTTGWVSDQHYLTEHQSLTAYTPTSGFSTVNGSAITSGGNITIDTSATVELTQAEYDALTAKTEGTLYVITDAAPIDIDDLSSKRLQEVDALPQTAADGDMVNYKDVLWKYSTGTVQTAFADKICGLLWAFRYDELPSTMDGEYIFKMHYSNNLNYDGIRYNASANTLEVIPSNNTSTVRATIPFNNATEVSCRTVDYSTHYYYFTWNDGVVYVRTNYDENMYDINTGFTLSGGWTKVYESDEIVLGNIATGGTVTNGIPYWDRYGRIVAKSSEVYGRSYQVNGSYFYPICTSSSNHPNIFAPTAAGTSGQVLVSAGSGAPSWQTMIKSQSITSADYDALIQAGTTDPNTLYLIID